MFVLQRLSLNRKGKWYQIFIRISDAYNQNTLLIELSELGQLNRRKIAGPGWGGTPQSG
jgi:hypothetical protein